MSSNYTLRRNVISRSIEKDGKAISDIDINTIYLNTRSAVSEKVTKDLVKSVLYSDFTVEYNPFKDFINTYSNSSLKEVNLNKLINSIKTDTPNHGLWVKKWLVGVIASIFEDHSPLMLVLCGGQNTGKTQWFRRLLPDPLSAYFAECKFQNGKDDEILMTQKLIVLDDELSGKSKSEDSKIKSLLSKQTFYLREPYGSVQVSLKRLAVLCGTTNLLQILNDPTGNRRFLPINVISIDHALYNSVHKYHLFIECYNLYKSGAVSHHLSKQEIELLNASTQEFETSDSETELINKYYKAPEENEETISEWITGAEILSKIKQSSGLHSTINSSKLGLILKKLGFVQRVFKVQGATVRRYKVIEITEPVNLNTNPYT